METVEMDLMQAQIGSLATDVARLEAKVAAGGGGGGFEYVTVTSLTPATQTTGTGTCDKTTVQIRDIWKSGKMPVFHLNAGLLAGTEGWYVNYIIPGQPSDTSEDPSIKFYIQTSINNNYAVIEFSISAYGQLSYALIA